MRAAVSAEPATRLRTHTTVVLGSVRVNIEADSINSAILGPDCAPGTELFDLLVKEVLKEITLKAGQKCTTIRRVFLPRQNVKAFGEAVASRLSAMKVGNPRNSEVKVGPVVNKAQQSACLEGLKKLRSECSVVFGGNDHFEPVDADPQKSAFVQPTLLASNDGLASKYVHDVEVFGPVVTLVAYDSPKDLV